MNALKSDFMRESGLRKVKNSMRAIKLKIENYDDALVASERVLRSGGVIAAPTDTVYGFIGNATDAHAIKKIFEIKQRSNEKAIPVFIKSIAEARRLAYISDAKARFLERVWPGAITVVFHHKNKLPPILTGNNDTAALRIPNHPFLLELLKRLDFPLAQTSANISGMPPARNAEEIKNYFQKSIAKPALIIDGGLMNAAPSALIDYTGATIRVLRMGGTSLNELHELLTRVGDSTIL